MLFRNPAEHADREPDKLGPCGGKKHLHAAVLGFLWDGKNLLLLRAILSWVEKLLLRDRTHRQLHPLREPIWET